MNKAFLGCLFFISSFANANTFIGNGGNSGDVELLVSREQIRGALEYIIKQPNAELCKCTPTFKNHAECKSIETLNEAQKLYCESGLRKMAPEVFTRLARTGAIDYQWTHEQISVVVGTSIVAAEAVTDPQQSKITLNHDRFIKQTPSERIFLLSHEMFHLVEFEGRHLNDLDPIGPFEDKHGQRSFLNAMAAAVVMATDRSGGFEKYAETLRRPQGHKENWFDLSYVAGNFQHENKSAFLIKKFAGVELSYRRYFGDWGLAFSYRYLEGDKKILTQIEAVEKLNAFSLVGTYRIFPFSNPLTRWGQSYFSPYAGVEYLTSKYELKDSLIGDDNKESSLGLKLGGKYFIPVGDLWASIGVDFTSPKYKHDVFGFLSTITLGVSHGF